jgi:hypothetical protein
MVSQANQSHDRDSAARSAQRTSLMLQGVASAAAAVNARARTGNGRSSTESNQSQGAFYKDTSGAFDPSATGSLGLDLSDFSISDFTTGNVQSSGPGEITQVLFQGLRARIGIWHGAMDRVIPHCKSGRADYLGRPSNRAARLMAAAQGGQVRQNTGPFFKICLELLGMSCYKFDRHCSVARTILRLVIMKVHSEAPLPIWCCLEVE